jgi:hypothetical protein
MVNELQKISGGSPVRAASLSLLMFMVIVLPAAAATQYVEVTKYRANNYSAVESSQNLSWTDMQSTLTNVYSNGPVYFQGPTFNASDPYGIAGENMINYAGHNGTYVRDLADLVSGMAAGDEIAIKASDGMTRHFNYTNVYEPYNDGTYAQGDLVLAWWDSVYGAVPTYSEGIRLFFYNPPATYGVADSLNMTLMDMYTSMAPWYRYNYSGIWPSAKGLSVKYVNQLKIYPPHRHDFNTTGDTMGWAFRFESPARPPATIDVPSTTFTDYIDDDDGIFKTENSNNYAAHRFNFSIDTAADRDGLLVNIEKIRLTWNGKGWHGYGGSSNGTYLYIWNQTGFEELTHSDNGNEETLTKEISHNSGNYINSGNVTLLAIQKTDGIGIFKSYLATDYVKMEVFHHHPN